MPQPDLEKAVRRRLADLAAWLGDREDLEDRFTVGDLMMTAVHLEPFQQHSR